MTIVNRTRRGGIVAAVAVATALLLLPTPARAIAEPAGPAAARDEPGVAGRDYPVTELVGQFGQLPKLEPNESHLTISKWGYRFQGGERDQDLVITEVDGKLRFVDRATTTWDTLPKTCTRQRVRSAAAALCTIPPKFRSGEMYIEIWPRLGNDRIDGTALPTTYRMWVLSDEGNDTVLMGAGRDFANTAFNRDTVSGGPGADWIRVGEGPNVVYGGPGNDELVGGEDGDRIHGGGGVDVVGGLEGNDTLWGDAGADTIRCAEGRDTAYRKGNDKIVDCETVRRR